jgi:hypothetical protein
MASSDELFEVKLMRRSRFAILATINMHENISYSLGSVSTKAINAINNHPK